MPSAPAARVFHFRPSLDIHNPAFREWVRLSVPLGLGISILMADSLYQRYFASGSPGDISRLYYARQLFTVPLGILGQTVGQASLPFFARLYGEKTKQGVRSYRKQSGNGNLRALNFVHSLVHGRGASSRRPGLSPWPIPVLRLTANCRIPLLFLSRTRILGHTSALCPGILCGWRLADTDGCLDYCHRCSIPDLRGHVQDVFHSRAGDRVRYRHRAGHNCSRFAAASPPSRPLDRSPLA